MAAFPTQQNEVDDQDGPTVYWSVNSNQHQFIAAYNQCKTQNNNLSNTYMQTSQLYDSNQASRSETDLNDF